MIKYRNPIPIDYTAEDNIIIKALFGAVAKQAPKVIKATKSLLKSSTKKAIKNTVKRNTKNNAAKAVKNGQYVKKPENSTPEKLRQRYVENQEGAWKPKIDYGLLEEIPDITVGATTKPASTVNPVSLTVLEATTVKPKKKLPSKKTVSGLLATTKPDLTKSVTQSETEPVALDQNQEIGLIRRIYGFEKPTRENMIGSIFRDALRVPLWASTTDLGLNLLEKVGSAIIGNDISTDFKFPLYNLTYKPLKSFYGTPDSTLVNLNTDLNTNLNIEQNDTIRNGQDNTLSTINYGETLFENIDNSNF